MLASEEQRSKKIVKLAAQLPADNSLSGRSVYWFVTTEEVDILAERTKLFGWEEKIRHTDEKGQITT